jgi:spoIIIJ-associated protein
VEWVETTGRSVEDAKEAALDELGVDEADAEFEVITEAQTGLFGRLRSEARVRARVRPTAPRAKEDRRDRRRRTAGRAGGAGAAESGVTTAASQSDPAQSDPAQSEPAQSDPDGGGTDRSETGLDEPGVGPDRSRAQAGRPSSWSETADASASEQSSQRSGGGGGGGRNRNRRRGGNRPGASPSSSERVSAERFGDDDQPGKGLEVDVDLDRQAEVAVDFLTKLTAEFGLDAKVTVARPDDDTVEVELSGSDLGILIGPKGATLLAVQNLTRTVVFNETGGSNGHINVDIGSYRHKRTEALARFATQVAEQVRSSGDRTPLEPMTAVDRKVVHDTISGIEGVNTISEGEEPRRRVVVLPG